MSLRLGSSTRSAGLALAVNTMGDFIPGGSSRALTANRTTRLIGARASVTGTARFYAKSAGVAQSPILVRDDARVASLTPLARNEWICWTISAKRADTRAKRLARLQEEIAGGKKRPCCWPGCPHRRESARNWVQA